MDIIEFIQKFFILLFPGIVGVFLYNALSIRKEQHYALEFLKMLCVSFFSYLLTDITYGTIKHFIPGFMYNAIDIVHKIGSNATYIPSENVILSVVWAVIISCILTKAVHENWVFRIANKLKLTHRVDDRTVWERVFDAGETIVLRDHVTGNIYYGVVNVYSDDSDNREILFDKVYVSDQYGEFLYEAEALYISRAYNEFTIEIPDDNEPIEDREGEINESEKQ